MHKHYMNCFITKNKSDRVSEFCVTTVIVQHATVIVQLPPFNWTLNPSPYHQQQKVTTKTHSLTYANNNEQEVITFCALDKISS